MKNYEIIKQECTRFNTARQALIKAEADISNDKLLSDAGKATKRAEARKAFYEATDGLLDAMTIAAEAIDKNITEHNAYIDYKSPELMEALDFIRVSSVVPDSVATSMIGKLTLPAELNLLAANLEGKCLSGSMDATAKAQDAIITPISEDVDRAWFAYQEPTTEAARDVFSSIENSANYVAVALDGAEE